MFIETLKRMDKLIRMKSTGNPGDFAAKLSLSERSIYNYLSVMKNLGAPISYSRYDESYYYSTQGGFIIAFKQAPEQHHAI